VAKLPASAAGPSAGQAETFTSRRHQHRGSAWATGFGALYTTTDNSGDTVDVVTGSFKPGTMYTAVTPCDANSAPAVCPAPGFPPHYLATVNMKTGAFTKVPLSGPALEPQGMIFVPAF
jgi:hypothetical protein